MRRSFIPVFVFTLGVLAFCAPGISQADYFQQDVHYTMHVRLDTKSKHLTGKQEIVYTNNSPDTLDELYLHLYANAYRNRHTAFMKFFRRRFNMNFIDIPRANRGWIDIANVRVNDLPVTPEVDETIARIPLPDRLAPGASLTLSLDFDEKIRRHIGRAGYKGRHYDLAQWYPKVAVYDENGFHARKWQTGEFYGEFGTFDVFITLPDNYVVAATGEVAGGNAGWRFNPPGAKGSVREAQGEREVHFHAERVHDFAWSADPTFVVQDTVLDNVTIRSVYRRSRASTWQDSTLVHGVRAYRWLTRTVGPYPYTQINIVDALLGGGMEYPMLVMDSRADEGLVVHEVGHIWFYGILGNDEQDAAWLDEGFTSFQTRWFMEERYGPYGNRSKLNWYERITPRPTLWEDYRNRVFPLLRRGYAERVATPSAEFVHSYRNNVYRKAALTLNAIRGIAGDDGMRRILHHYFDRWKLKHVNEERFRASVEEVTGLNLKYEFEAWLHTKKICDYKLTDVRTRPDGDSVSVRVSVDREDELFLPLDIEFEMPDGNRITRRVDGRPRWIRKTFRLPAPPKRTTVGPGNTIMDIDFADNTLPRRRRFLVDWPGNNYYPEDAYTLRHRPAAWYNDVDGAKLGYHLRGSYYNWARRFRLGLYYGINSERLDFSAAYDKPMAFLGQRGRFVVETSKMEGRRNTDIHADFANRAKLSRPPEHSFRIGYNRHELTEPRYLVSTEIYDTNQADVSVYTTYRVSPQADIFSTSLEAGLRLGRRWTGGRYRYERFHADLRAYSRREYLPVDIRLRAFVGILSGSLPTQRKFALAGAGPVAQSQRFWTRSPGAVWENLNYHDPGDGNLRGYTVGSFGVNRLLAFNAEAGTRLPLWKLGTLVRPLTGRISWYAFYDAGKTLDDANPIGSSTRVQALVDAGVLNTTIQDAGIGFRSEVRWPFWHFTARLDLPLWLSRPDIIGETDRTRFRYLLSATSTF